MVQRSPPHHRGDPTKPSNVYSLPPAPWSATRSAPPEGEETSHELPTSRGLRVRYLPRRSPGSGSSCYVFAPSAHSTRINSHPLKTRRNGQLATPACLAPLVSRDLTATRAAPPLFLLLFRPKSQQQLGVRGRHLGTRRTLRGCAHLRNFEEAIGLKDLGAGAGASAATGIRGRNPNRHP